MRDARWGMAVSGVAVVLVVSGCGGSGSDAGGPATPSVTLSVVPVEPDAVEPESTEPVYPSGPEGEIDERADGRGWEYDSLYGSASEFVQDMCDSLPSQAKHWSPGQWLAEGGYLDGDGAEILKFGIPKLCPKWEKTLKAAVAGTYERWMSSGDYEVVRDPEPYDADSESDVQQVGPGTYRVVGRVEDCYWERTTKGGDIIANQFVTQATELTVTLRVGELFKNDGCGAFRPVG